MRLHKKYMSNIRQQWELFQDDKLTDPEIVPPVIMKSWKRCRDLGVSPDDKQREILAPEALSMLLKEKSELVEVAKSVMERIYEPISSSGSIISLSDENGVVLHALWNTHGSYPTPHITPGCIASERTSGTNAIGICTVEKKAVETRGAEHYCRALHGWYCCAAPIWHDGKLEGVLNVTLPANAFHPHSRGLLETVSFSISEQLRLRSLLREYRATLEMLDEGVVVFDHGGKVHSINKVALRMLGHGGTLDPARPLCIPELILSKDILRAITAETAVFRDQEAFITHAKGSLHCAISLAQVEACATRVLTLRPNKHIRESAVRFTGAKAVYTFEHIVGESTPIAEVVRMGRLAAQSGVTTLILGESGTGKELFAQAIHNASSRANAPFVVVNCGALPRDLVQSELFGYDEGSFTGASRLGKPGKFELADHGTIFLDEIGEMPLIAQISLLRLLQNGEVTRVGGKQTRHVDVRVIAATNRNLEEAIQQNAFREDLFYRLNVFTLNIPPLRERMADLPLLVRHFLYRFAMAQGKSELEISSEALEIMGAYGWPGNVRELENTLERMAHMVGQNPVIDTTLLPQKILSPGTASPHTPRGVLGMQEKGTLIRILHDHKGNLRAAAQELGISRSGLYVKLKRFGLLPTTFRQQGGGTTEA